MIVTKILVERLALLAPKIVSSNQRGFILGRTIFYCICTALEAANLLRGNVAIKIDIKKAFDTLHCDFLMDVLEAFGFHQKFSS